MNQKLEKLILGRRAMPFGPPEGPDKPVKRLDAGRIRAKARLAAAGARRRSR